MSCVLRVDSLVTGLKSPYDGQYLVGHILGMVGQDNLPLLYTSPDPNEAKHFDTQDQAIAYYRQKDQAGQKALYSYTMTVEPHYPKPKEISPPPAPAYTEKKPPPPPAEIVTALELLKDASPPPDLTCWVDPLEGYKPDPKPNPDYELPLKNKRNGSPPPPLDRNAPPPSPPYPGKTIPRKEFYTLAELAEVVGLKPQELHRFIPLAHTDFSRLTPGVVHDTMQNWGDALKAHSMKQTGYPPPEEIKARVKARAEQAALDGANPPAKPKTPYLPPGATAAKAQREPKPPVPEEKRPWHRKRAALREQEEREERERAAALELKAEAKYEARLQNDAGLVIKETARIIREQCSLTEGSCALSFPNRMSEQSYREFREWLHLIEAKLVRWSRPHWP